MNDFVKLPQFIRGKKVESYLDEVFRARGFQIRQTTDKEERDLCLGDRCFSKDGNEYFVEYKSGIQTHYTKNIFLETISVDDPDSFREGWVYTCKADFIVYATVLDDCLLVFIPDDLRAMIDVLKRRFPEVPTSNNQNKGYNTHGVIIPFEWAKENLARRIISLKHLNRLSPPT